MVAELIPPLPSSGPSPQRHDIKSRWPGMHEHVLNSWNHTPKNKPRFTRQAALSAPLAAGEDVFAWRTSGDNVSQRVSLGRTPRQ